MDLVERYLNLLNGIVWGVPMLILILGTGLYLMLLLGFMPLRRLATGFKMMWAGRSKGDSSTGEVSPFQALMTCLSATVGTGNIAGVATAIFVGGPGALFWMWCTALVGMATKYSEVMLSVHFREKDERGEFIGGPMYVIKNGLGVHWQWLGAVFALFGGLAGFGIGNMVQANTLAEALQVSFAIPTWVSGLIASVTVALVILGGVKRIGQVSATLVPFMCIAYLVAGMVVLVVFANQIPHAFSLIFSSAFTGTAATGGFAGAAVMMSIQYGVARGVFSNEAGLGTAGIAQSAGTTTDPVRSGLIGMMGTFIDTIVVCSVTGLAIICSGVWSGGQTGSSLSSMAFDSAMPGMGGAVVAIALSLFTFTTILGWSYYGEKCWIYLVGRKSVMPFRCLWVIAVMAGAVFKAGLVWSIADLLNALMAIPNLMSLLLLSPLVFKLTKQYFAAQVKGS